MSKISIVIPALNEEDGIEKTIQKIPKQELEQMGYEIQILVVDNGSEDRTGELARNAGAEVIVEQRRGYGRAYKTGFQHANGDIITTIDADTTYPTEDIPRLVTILEEEDLEFLTTNRFAYLTKEAMSFKHKLGNQILALETNLLFRVNMKDPESGMWVFRRNILDRMKIGSDSWPFSHELKLEACYFAKCRWKEVAINYSARQGTTKIMSSWRTGLTDFLHILRKRIIR